MEATEESKKSFCRTCIYYDGCEDKIDNCKYFYNINSENQKEIIYYYKIFKENKDSYNNICNDFN